MWYCPFWEISLQSKVKAGHLEISQTAQGLQISEHPGPPRIHSWRQVGPEHPLAAVPSPLWVRSHLCSQKCLFSWTLSGHIPHWWAEQATGSRSGEAVGFFRALSTPGVAAVSQPSSHGLTCGSCFSSAGAAGCVATLLHDAAMNPAEGNNSFVFPSMGSCLLPMFSLQS